MGFHIHIIGIFPHIVACRPSRRQPWTAFSSTQRPHRRSFGLTTHACPRTARRAEATPKYSSSMASSRPCSCTSWVMSQRKLSWNVTGTRRWALTRGHGSPRCGATTTLTVAESTSSRSYSRTIWLCGRPWQAHPRTASLMSSTTTSRAQPIVTFLVSHDLFNLFLQFI